MVIQCFQQCSVHHPATGNDQHTTTWEVMNNYECVSKTHHCIENRSLIQILRDNLKVCCFIRPLCVLIPRHGRIIVHLQTLHAAPPDLVVLVALFAALAALAAAAAALATEAHAGSHHRVPGRHGVQGPGQEVPGAQDPGQEAGTASLHHVDNDHKDDQHNDGHADADQDLPAGYRQAEHSQRQNQEAQEEVEGGEPTVFGRMVPQPPGQPDGHSHEGDWIPQ